MLSKGHKRTQPLLCSHRVRCPWHVCTVQEVAAWAQMNHCEPLFVSGHIYCRWIIEPDGEPTEMVCQLGLVIMGDQIILTFSRYGVGVLVGAELVWEGAVPASGCSSAMIGAAWCDSVSWIDGIWRRAGVTYLSVMLARGVRVKAWTY